MKIMKRLSTKILPKNIIKIFKFFRRLGFFIIEPVDYFIKFISNYSACPITPMQIGSIQAKIPHKAKFINDKKDFPSLYLRRYVGPLRGFESSGAEFLAYLKLLCKFQPDEKILDIGCGCGLMGLYLKDYLNSQGRYVGADIHKLSIEWCQKK